MKFLQRRAGCYEFRFPFPDDLAGKSAPQPWPDALTALVNARMGRFKTELIRSLQTNDRPTAERKILIYIAELHRLVDQARQLIQGGPRTSVSADYIAALARDHEIHLLGTDEAIRAKGMGLDMAREDGQGPHDGLGMTVDDLCAYRMLVDELDRYTRQQAAQMRPGESTTSFVNPAVEARGIVLPPDDPAWRQLELAFVRAQRSALAGIRARLDGDDVETPQKQREPTGLALSAALRLWAEAGGAGARKPQPFSVAEAERSARRFIELHGDLPIVAITKTHARAFRDALVRLPKALPARLGQLPLPELLKQDLSKYPRCNAQTVNKTLALLSGVLARAERDGHFETLSAWSNPFQVDFDVAPAECEPYEPFSTAELQRLFASPVFAGSDRPRGGQGEAAYWSPLIALFSGARRTEIAQLKIGDVRQGDGGIWYFDITNEGADQNLKTASSARSVPIHRKLIQLGLLNVVTARARLQPSNAPFWPAFAPPIDPKVKAWTKWFGRYLSVHVVDSRAKTFHSFRHTFKRACREAGLSKEVHNALTGHAGGGVGRRYGRERRADGTLDCGISLGRLRIEIDKIIYQDIAIPQKKYKYI
ncbi:site-specific integrase [Methylorubrum populi]|uniref:site-specific integrase n=1 Tax=Methylorubrum populi TaxID=223967 RepID=UPI001150CB2E|nr:site-specific integrase [Methylorubrum populi]QDI82171.1 site-specific integrase [Methylorubrum populi]